MKYWLYAQGEISGPFNAEELVSREGFRLTALVCPEDKMGETGGDWKCASEFSDFNPAAPAETPEPQEQPEQAAEQEPAEAAREQESFEPEDDPAQQQPQEPAAEEPAPEPYAETPPNDSKPGEQKIGGNEPVQETPSENSPAGEPDSETLDMLKRLGYSEQEARQLVKFDGSALETSAAAQPEQTPEHNAAQNPAGRPQARPAAKTAGKTPPAESGKAAGQPPRALGEVAPAWLAALNENELLQELAQDSSRFALDSSDSEEPEETAADYMAAHPAPHHHKKHGRHGMQEALAYAQNNEEDFEEAPAPQPGARRPQQHRRHEQPHNSARGAPRGDTSAHEMDFPQQIVSPNLLDTELYHAEDPAVKNSGAARAVPAREDLPEDLLSTRSMDLSALARDTMIGGVFVSGAAAAADRAATPTMRDNLVTSLGMPGGELQHSQLTQPSLTQSLMQSPEASATAVLPLQPTTVEPAPLPPADEPAAEPAPNPEDSTARSGISPAASKPASGEAAFMGDIQSRIAALSRTERSVSPTADPSFGMLGGATSVLDNRTQVPAPGALSGDMLTEAFTKTSLQMPGVSPGTATSFGGDLRLTKTQFSPLTDAGLRTVHVAEELPSARLTGEREASGGKRIIGLTILGLLILLVPAGLFLAVRGCGGKKKSPEKASPAPASEGQNQPAAQPGAEQPSAQPTSGAPAGMTAETGANAAGASQATPASAAPADDIAGLSAKSELAVSIVKQHKLPGGRGSIENWFANTLVAGLGGSPYEEKWESKSCYRSTCYVYYKLLQPRKEPVQYGFVVDTDSKVIKSGINNKAVELLGGDDTSSAPARAGATASQGTAGGRTNAAGSYDDYPAASSAKTGAGKTGGSSYSPAGSGKPRNTARKKPSSLPDQLPLPKDPGAGKKKRRSLIEEMSADERGHYDSMMDDERKKRKPAAE